jgi:hypothetical protein
MTAGEYWSTDYGREASEMKRRELTSGSRNLRPVRLSKKMVCPDPTVIEQKLFLMFLEHRMRAFQGRFHANPDYALWYGWSEMTRDLTEIKMLSEDLRNSEKKK